ncbi:Zn-ribbon domain-containing OB-fold protein [Chelativorans alearense]|uniref:Zn-ribbon domain-containing OB-fold protein n=1 Tax=Chelativorans alearense TaxID=2681495 RepID=UPI001FE4C288|nr:Zn-ribbon domain-containing OB-fold protein [Chelativorans alearense]
MTVDKSLVNGDSEPYWAAAALGRLVFQKCGQCSTVQFPPRHHCATCWGSDLDWIESSGRGTVESCTVVRRAPSYAFADKVPYAVASVIVDEGPRMIASVVGEGALDVRIGDAVSVVFDADTGLPQFRCNQSGPSGG